MDTAGKVFWGFYFCLRYEKDNYVFDLFSELFKA